MSPTSFETFASGELLRMTGGRHVWPRFWRTAACDNGAAMPTTVVCSRCGEEKPALDAAPMGGAMGARVLAGVCAECWAEWRQASPRVINHYGLVMGNPEHRAQLRVAMLEFLGLEEEER